MFCPTVAPYKNTKVKIKPARGGRFLKSIRNPALPYPYEETRNFVAIAGKFEVCHDHVGSHQNRPFSPQLCSDPNTRAGAEWPFHYRIAPCYFGTIIIPTFRV